MHLTSPRRRTPSERDAQRELRPAESSVQTQCGMTAISSMRQRPLRLLDPTATPPAPSIACLPVRRRRWLFLASCYPNKREAKFLFRSQGNEMRPPAFGYYTCLLVSLMNTSVRLHSSHSRITILFLSSYSEFRTEQI